MNDMTSNVSPERLNGLILTFEHAVSSASDSIDKFASSFQENPLHALEWSASIFADAARKEVYEAALKGLRNVLDGKITMEFLVGFFRREALNRASSTSRSTSPTSNLLDDERRIAYVRAYQMLTDEPLAYL